MRKILMLALLMGFFQAAMAENVDAMKLPKPLMGKVVDAKTGEPLAGAEVRCGEQIVFTNFEGEFLLPASVQREELEVEVRLISYEASKQKLPLSKSSSPYLIQLKS